MIELIQVSFINIIAKLLKFAFEIGTNYFVDKETYGFFAILLSYILIYSRIVTFGIPNVMLREFPKRINKSYISYLLFNSTIIIIFITIFSFMVIYSLNIKYLSLYISIPLIALSTALLTLYSSYLRSLGNIKLWIFFQDISWYIYYFSGLAFLYFSSNSMINIDTILSIYTYSIVLSFLSVLLIVKFKYKLLLISKLSLKKLKYIYSHSFPVLFTGLTYLILARIDVIMLGNYVDIELVGEYNIVARISIQVLFFYQVLTAYFYPRLAKKFALKESNDDIARYTTKFVLLSFLSVTSLSMVLFVLITYFNLFDTLGIIHQEELFMVFLIFMGTQVIYSIIGFYGYILLYIHKQKIEYFNNLIILIVGILLNLLLIPIYGTIGAALASAVAILLGNLLEMLQVKYYTKYFYINVMRSR